MRFIHYARVVYMSSSSLCAATVFHSISTRHELTLLTVFLLNEHWQAFLISAITSKETRKRACANCERCAYQTFSSSRCCYHDQRFVAPRKGAVAVKANTQISLDQPARYPLLRASGAPKWTLRRRHGPALAATNSTPTSTHAQCARVLASLSPASTRLLPAPTSPEELQI